MLVGFFLQSIKWGLKRNKWNKKEIKMVIGHLLDDAEEIDVGVVDGEVDGDEPRAAADPKPFH